jgi:integrase
MKEEGTKPKANESGGIDQVSSPKGKNTITAFLKITRAFWNFARKDLRQQNIEIGYPFGVDGYQIAGESYGQPIYITKEERNRLFTAELPSERLQKVRDIFVFQCLIAARVGDLCKLTKANIQNNVLSYIPRKTKDGKPVTVTVPLHNNAIEILSRYDIPDGRLLPFITDQRYNIYLKELFREVGINRIVTRLNPTTSEPEQVKICDIVSSHMARRAFVGNLYGKVDSGIISSMTGHIQGSKAFTRYYDVSPELQKEAINLID